MFVFALHKYRHCYNSALEIFSNWSFTAWNLFRTREVEPLLLVSAPWNKAKASRSVIYNSNIFHYNANTFCLQWFHFLCFKLSVAVTSKESHVFIWVILFHVRKRHFFFALKLMVDYVHITSWSETHIKIIFIMVS